MNFITRRNRINETLERYIQFMPFCPKESVFKLTSEIMNIHSEIEVIKCMSAKELSTTLAIQYVILPSKTN